MLYTVCEAVPNENLILNVSIFISFSFMYDRRQVAQWGANVLDKEEKLQCQQWASLWVKTCVAFSWALAWETLNDVHFMIKY